MLREAAEREKLLKLRIAQWSERHDKQRLEHRLAAWRLEDIIDAQRLVIERLIAERDALRRNAANRPENETALQKVRDD